MGWHIASGVIGFLIGLFVGAVLIEFLIWSGNPHLEAILIKLDAIERKIEDLFKWH